MSDSALNLDFPSVGGKPVTCCFDGGDVTSDAGLLLLRQADRRLGLTARMAEQIVDRREPGKVVHSVVDLLRERIFAIAAGYEDANDLDDLCVDPALLLACEKQLGAALASQPTVSRLENAVDRKDAYCLAESLCRTVIAQLPKRTQHVVVDVDPTDDPCHGQQEFEFFNGYYDTHCYLPLYVHITGGDKRQRLAAALLRHGKASWEAGLFGTLTRVAALLRERHPGVRITLRADGGFGNGEVLSFCEDEGFSYVLGLPQNARLRRQTQALEEQVLRKSARTGKDQKVFMSFWYQADSWERPRRVVAKVETVGGKLNVRYVVTSRTQSKPGAVYRFYCERGDRENRIKEMKIDLSAGRTSCHRFVANQFRLLLHAAACVLWNVVQEALDGTVWANQQIGTLRLKLVKVGARVIQTCRRIWLHLPTSCPAQDLWRHLQRNLAPLPT